LSWNEADDLYLRHSINLIQKWANAASVVTADLDEADLRMTIIAEQAEVVIKSIQKGASPWHDMGAPLDYIAAVDPELLAACSLSTNTSDGSPKPTSAAENKQ
jgi:hypothetical protein